MPTTYSEKKDNNSIAWTVVISQMRYQLLEDWQNTAVVIIWIV